jgi:hypothetical protein
MLETSRLPPSDPGVFPSMNNFQDKANFIWQVADDILRGTFKQHE